MNGASIVSGAVAGRAGTGALLLPPNMNAYASAPASAGAECVASAALVLQRGREWVPTPSPAAPRRTRGGSGPTLASSNKLQFYAGNGVSWSISTSGSMLTPHVPVANAWNHVALAFEASAGYTIYLNGSSESSLGTTTRLHPMYLQDICLGSNVLHTAATPRPRA